MIHRTARRLAPIRCALISSFLVCGTSAFSQVANSLPSKEQIELPKPTAETPPSKVRVDGSKGISAAPCALDKYDLQVSISSIQFSGPGGAALPSAIAPLLAGVAGAPPKGENKIAIVCDIRDRATAILRGSGYVASVQIPPQKIEDGVLRLEVVTARIVEIHVHGDAGPYRRTLAARIAQLKALKPLNEHDAERILLLADDVPGLDVQLALRPAGTAPGDVVGDLNIATHRAAFLANTQNYGSKQLGRLTAYGRAEVYGLIGGSSLTSIAGQATADFHEQTVLQAVHQMGVGNDGVTMAVSGTYAYSRPDLGTLDLRARSVLASAEVDLPVIRSVKTNLRLAGGIDLTEQRTKVYGVASGGTPLNRDRIRTAFLRAVASYHEPRADGSDAFSIGGRVEVRKGLDILGATQAKTVSSAGYTPSRFEGRSTATVVQGDFDAMIAPAGAPISLAASVRGQWANAPLLNYDEFSIGNLSVGRGYDPGANSGDRAVALRGEARLKLIDQRLIRMEGFGFYDTIFLWNLDTGAIENNRTLRSLGGGVRIMLPGLAMIELTYAHPKDRALLLPGTGRSVDRFLISVTTRLATGGR